MPQLPRFEKYRQDPEDVLDYLWNWQKSPNPFLGDGETIIGSDFSATDERFNPVSDITLSMPTNTTTTATIWVSTLTRGKYYVVTNHIVTSDGREKDESILIICEEQ